MDTRAKSKKQMIQELYVDRKVPGEYREFDPWIMGKSEFHLLYERSRMGSIYSMHPDIEVGADLRACKVVCRANYQEPMKSLERGLQDELGLLKELKEKYIASEGAVVPVRKIRGIKRRKSKPIKIDGKYLVDRPVNQYDKKTGILIREYESGHRMEEETGYIAKRIVDVCTGRRATAYKYKWKFGDK